MASQGFHATHDIRLRDPDVTQLQHRISSVQMDGTNANILHEEPVQAPRIRDQSATGYVCVCECICLLVESQQFSEGMLAHAIACCSCYVFMFGIVMRDQVFDFERRRRSGEAFAN